MMIALGLALLLSAPANLPARVDALLGTIDVPATREEWRALGKDAIPLLETIARDQRQMATRRSIALSALGFLGAREAAKEIAADPRERASVRRSAARSLAR